MSCLLCSNPFYLNLSIKYILHSITLLPILNKLNNRKTEKMRCPSTRQKEIKHVLDLDIFPEC